MSWMTSRRSTTTFPTGNPVSSSSWGAWLGSHALVAAAILVLVALILYAPALAGSFIFIDSFEIQGNPAVTTPGLWLQNFTYSVGTALAGRGYYYRPLYFFSYWLVYQLAGPQPFAFHLFQLMLYAAAIWMLFRLGCELLHDEGTAFVGALLWVVHPAHVEAVAWISSLFAVGCGVFYFWAFRLFLQAETVERHAPIAHLKAALA